MKRTLDFIVSGVALVVLAPLLICIAIAIKLDSRGRVIFKQQRVGLRFRPFNIYKFRTMVAGAEQRGPLLTVAGDPRITRVGRWLRQTKLDELPQLFNVFVGHMSLVGPRPEVPRYVEMFRKDYEEILSIRPGITDVASYHYKDEAAILAAAPDPEAAYVRVVLPDKIRVSKQWLKAQSASEDWIVVIKTIVEALLMQTVPVRYRAMRHRRPFIILLSLMLALCSNYAAFWLRFDGQIPPVEHALMVRLWLWLLLFRAAVFVPFRLYEGLWRHTDIWDLRNIIAGVMFSTVPFFVTVRWIYGSELYPRSVFVIDAMLLVILMGGLRMLWRIYHDLVVGGNRRRIIICGADDSAALVARHMRRGGFHEVIGFVTPNRAAVGQWIHGVRVIGLVEDLPRLAAKHKPDEILVAGDGANGVRDLLAAVQTLRLPIRAVSSTWSDVFDVTDGAVVGVRSIRVEDLLPRFTPNVSAESLQPLVEGRTILVTGAGGTLGKELSSQIAALGPAVLVLFERSGSRLDALRDLLLPHARDSVVHAVIGDVSDEATVTRVFTRFRPHVVFHLAGCAHGELLEENPGEAIRTNVQGTRVVAQAADAVGTQCFVLVSNAAAATGHGIAGASKRLSELVVQDQARGSRTSYCTVRVPNVLAGGGAVIQKLLAQIRSRTITLDDPARRCRFMHQEPAARLLLHVAAQHQTGGTYALQAGEPVVVEELARDIVRLCGLVPDQDVLFKFGAGRLTVEISGDLVGSEERATSESETGVVRVRRSTEEIADLMPRVSELEAHAAAERFERAIRCLYDLTEGGSAVSGSTVRKQGVPAAALLAVGVTSTAGPSEEPCPVCAGRRVHRARTRTPWDRLRRLMSERRLHRCEDCHWTGWRLPHDAAGGEPPDAQAAPDLRLLDFRPAASAEGERSVPVPMTLAPAARVEHDGQRCPRCKNGRVYRSHARTPVERIKKELTSERPHRCDDCGWRGWVTPMEFGDRAPVDAVPSPDLDSLDAAVKSPSVAPRRVFPPRNLT